MASAAAKPRLKHRLEYIALRGALGAVRAMPLDRASDLLASLTRRLMAGTRRHRRALANIALALPERSEAERQEIVLAMWENVGRVIAEGAHLDTFLAEPHRLDGVDMRFLDEYQEKIRPALVASLHTANWEIGMIPSSARGFRPAAFYRNVSNPLVEDHVKRARETIYQGGLFAIRGEGPSIAATQRRSMNVLASIKAGVPVGILCDQLDNEGIDVPFLGQTVKVSRGAATLAVQLGAHLCVARTIRLGATSRFVGEAHQIILPNSGNRFADIETITRAIMAKFEEWIRELPEQWLWSQAPFVDSRGQRRSVADTPAGA